MAIKHFFALLTLILVSTGLQAQTEPDWVEGIVSFQSSQHTYVKFNSTGNISAGDTLFIRRNNQLTPALVIGEMSSTSCVCMPLSGITLAVADKVAARRKQLSKQDAEKQQQEIVSEKQDPVKAAKPVLAEKSDGQPEEPGTKLTGRVTVASYNGFSNTPAGNSQKMRYTLSVNAGNIADPKLSAETYLSFVHRFGQWDEIQHSVFHGLKIYSLALNYALSPGSRLWLGRKINPRISSVGAIDGLQYELRMGAFSTGLVSGFRPAADDYGFDSKLLQFGGYLAHDFSKNNRFMQSTLAVMEQQNAGMTDRRFAYLQHGNALVRNLYFFGSLEADLYRKTAEKTDYTPRLVNTYLSLRYRMSTRLSMTASFNARENIIYYETYKNYLERLLEDINQRGVTFQFHYQPLRKMSVGASAGYRSARSDPKPSRNLYAYVSFPDVPLVRVSATLSATLLETSYLHGNIYSLGVSRDILPGKVFAGLKYSFVDYRYNFGEEANPQQVGEIDLHLRIGRKLTLSVYAESIFEKEYNYQQLYFSISQGF